MGDAVDVGSDEDAVEVAVAGEGDAGDGGDGPERGDGLGCRVDLEDGVRRAGDAVDVAVRSEDASVPGGGDAGPDVADRRDGHVSTDR